MSGRRVPEQFSVGGDKDNAQKAWLDGYDTAIRAAQGQTKRAMSGAGDVERLIASAQFNVGCEVNGTACDVVHPDEPKNWCIGCRIRHMSVALRAAQERLEELERPVTDEESRDLLMPSNWKEARLIAGNNRLAHELAVTQAGVAALRTQLQQAREALGAAQRLTVPDEWEGDLATEHPNRCTLRDNLLYADIFNDDGSHRAVWRCHKRAGHDGPCSSHNDCGVMNGGVVCGKLPGHAGPHAWATPISVPDLLSPTGGQ